MPGSATHQKAFPELTKTDVLIPLHTNTIRVTNCLKRRYIIIITTLKLFVNFRTTNYIQNLNDGLVLDNNTRVTHCSRQKKGR